MFHGFGLSGIGSVFLHFSSKTLVFNSSASTVTWRPCGVHVLLFGHPLAPVACPLGLRGRPLAALGRPWLPLAAPGRLWPPLAPPWLPLAGPGRPWPPLLASGRPWPPLAAPGRPWSPLAAPGRPWPPLAPGRPWPLAPGRPWPLDQVTLAMRDHISVFAIVSGLGFGLESSHVELDSMIIFIIYFFGFGLRCGLSHFQSE